MPRVPIDADKIKLAAREITGHDKHLACLVRSVALSTARRALTGDRVGETVQPKRHATAFAGRVVLKKHPFRPSSRCRCRSNRRWRLRRVRHERLARYQSPQPRLGMNEIIQSSPALKAVLATINHLTRAARI
jgi:hypothetical protein